MSFVSLRKTLLLFSVCFCLRTWAQDPVGVLEGLISDPSGATVSRADVTVSNPRTGLSKTQQSASDGLFHFASLPSGEYNLRVSAGGFAAFSVSSIRIDIGRTVRITVKLEVAAGHGLTQLHAASIAGGRPGVLHGNRTYLLMDEDGQIQDAHSISAGLDYPGIGPEHSWLHETGRVKYLSATDDEALAAFQLLSRLEGIIPALEPAHAIAKVMELAPQRPKDHLMVVNLSGRGDKDIPQVADILRGKK